MASLKSVKRSPYWYIRHRDTDTGSWRDESTKYRRDNPQDTRAAQKLADKYSHREATIRPEIGSEFVAWVPDYLRSHYTRENTLRRTQNAWTILREWMLLRNIRHPRQIRYLHAQDYMAWRRGCGAGQNTARMEVKFLSFLLNEAIRREFCDHNPLAQAKIDLAPSKEKPEIPDAELREARTFFLRHEAPEWCLDVFEILMNLGCRFVESSIRVEDIDFEARAIRMTDSKRKDSDPRKRFLVPITDQFAQFLEKFRGKERTVPPLTREMNHRFNRLLKQACGATSHSFRVSFITRCHRAGLTETECMRLVNHSQHSVHRVYSRLNLNDARAALARVPLPPPHSAQ